MNTPGWLPHTIYHRRKILPAILSAMLTASCSGLPGSEHKVSTPASPPAPAGKLLKAHSTPAGSVPQQTNTSKFKYRHLLSDAAQNENRMAPQGAPGPNGPWGGYDPMRLARAGQPHEWWPVDGPESGFQVHLRTQWHQGKLTADIVMVGPVVNINRFIAGIRSIQVIVTDAPGNPLVNWALEPSDFHWDTNDGVGGQFAFQTEVEYPLESYEQFQTWNFLWTNR